jgi:hypothetical protein
MRDEWYSDNRDLVKWGVLLQLAELYDMAAIFQVAYYRPTPWDEKSIEIDGRAFPLPPVVVSHFRDIKNIRALRPNARVMVLDDPFHDRDQYLRRILMEIRNLLKPAIVFLDPDTGLEPKKATLKHVREKELQEIWRTLRRGDLLVFYQHRTRRRQWVKEKKTQFEKAIGLEPGGSKLARGKGIASDVAFFFSHRPDAAEMVKVSR